MGQCLITQCEQGFTYIQGEQGFWCEIMYTKMFHIKKIIYFVYAQIYVVSKFHELSAYKNILRKFLPFGIVD